MPDMCSKLILYFTQLYFLPLIIAGVARARPAVMSPAFIGCQCSEWAVFVASNQSDRSNSVPRALFSSLVFIYALCKLQVEAVTYDETYTVDCPDSLQGIPLITIFFF